MTRIASQLNKVLMARRDVEREQVWYSVSDLITALTGPHIGFSEVLPNGAVIKEVQVTTRPDDVDVIYQARIRLHLVESIQVSLAQIVECERVIRWIWHESDYGWTSLGLIHDDRYLCHKTVHGANLHIASVVEFVGGGSFRFRVAVRFKLP